MGPRMEICDTSGIPIPMVPRFHQSNGYIKRKLRVWRAQNSNAVDGAETVLSSAGPQTTPFHGGQYRAKNGNMRNSNLPIPLVPLLNPSNGYIKKKLRVWRAHKSNAVVGAETVLTSAGPQSTPLDGVQYRAENGNMRNFGITNSLGTTFAPKQWLY